MVQVITIYISEDEAVEDDNGNGKTKNLKTWTKNRRKEICQDSNVDANKYIFFVPFR